MSELDIKSFFTKMAGDNNVLGSEDVESGFLDKNIARNLGIIDENGNYTDKTYTLEQFGSEVDINDLINKVKVKSEDINTKRNTNKTNENGSRAVSSQKYTLSTNNGNKTGTLTKYEDGSLEFDASNGIEFFNLKYKNEEDFKNKHPYQFIKGTKFRNNDTRTISKYEYYPNGKLKHTDTKTFSGEYISERDNDEKGCLIKENKYKDGKLILVTEGSWKDPNTHEAVTKTASGNVVEKNVATYENDKIKSSAKYNKDGVLVSDRQYEDGKLKTSKQYYSDGKMKLDAEFFPETGGFKSIKYYNNKGETLQDYTADMVPDGKAWDKPAAQVGQGDCYLVATVNAIRELADGDKMLSSLIDIQTDANGKKIYTVTLPGAQIAARALKNDNNIDPNKMYITGKYTFSEDEFAQIAKQQGSRYSIGNANIILLEAAFERYREEVKKTVHANNLNPRDNVAIPGLYYGRDGSLAGGQTYDATFVLTGKSSKLYVNEQPELFLDKDALGNGELKFVSNNKYGMEKAAAPSSVDGEPTNEKSDLNRMLNEIMNDMKDGKKDIIASACFFVYNPITKQKTGHAFTIKEVTADTVTIINPWHPDSTLTMSRADFLASTDTVTICDTSKNTKLPEREINGGKPHKHEQKPNNNSKPPKTNKPPHKHEQNRVSPQQEAKDKKKIADIFKNWDKYPKANISSKAKKLLNYVLNG